MHILIVEDDFIIADMIERILRRNGFTSVMHVDNLTDANKALATHPDVCLLDIRLDGESGIDFAKVIHKLNIPFLFITANTELETIKLVAQTHPQGYLSKPINEKDLIAAIEIIRINTSKFIWVKTKVGQVKVLQNDILFLEADNVNVKLFCENESYLIRKSLKEFESELEPFFVRAHRSFIVNKNKIEFINSQAISILDFKIPISKGFKL